MKTDHLNPYHPRRWPLMIGLGALCALSKLPMPWWHRVAFTLGAGLQRVVPSRRRVVMRNLELAFPDRDESWRRQLCDQSYQALALSLFETSKLWFSDPAWLDDYVQIEGLEHLQACQQRGEAVLLVSCHFTAIEVAGAALCRAQPFHPVYAAAKNAQFDQFQRDKRLRFAPDVVLRSDMRKAMRVLRDGGILWLLPDQAVSSGHGAVPTEFFGQPVLSSTGPARLQKRSGAKMVFFELERKAGKLKVVVSAPEKIDDKLALPEQAQALNDVFERMIKRSPSLYFWHHKRFKTGLPGVNPYH